MAEQHQGGLPIERFDTLDRRALCRAHLLQALLGLQAAHAIAERIADDVDTKLPSLIADARGLVNQSIAQFPRDIPQLEQTITHGVIQR